MAKKKGRKKVTTTHEERRTHPRVVFHLPEELLKAVDREAEANDRTRTAQLIRIIREWAARQG
jgi:hypothetical protein